MAEKRLTKDYFEKFYQYLKEDEHEHSTIEKYMKDVQAFAAWIGKQAVSKEQMARWKEHLQKSGLQPVTINGKLSALNKLFSFLGWSGCRVKYLKIQRKMFRDEEKELTKKEYTSLVETAYSLGKERLALLIETICATGIRVSEIKYITVEAIRSGRAEIALKGKIRTILLLGNCAGSCSNMPEKRRLPPGGIPHWRRKRIKQTANMGGNESHLRSGWSSGIQGVSPQSPASLCPIILPGLPGCGKIGGCVGTFQY